MSITSDYYNFNGNCTVQQASGDGQPNSVQMVGGTVVRQTSPNQTTTPLNIPPVPPPVHEPIHHQGQGPPHSGYSNYAHEAVRPVDNDKRPRASSALYSSLQRSHLPSIPGPSRPSPLSGPLTIRQTSFMNTNTASNPPTTSAVDRRVTHASGGGGPGVLPRLRSFDTPGPISLAPLKGEGMMPMNAYHPDDGRGQGRPNKRARLSQNVGLSMGGPEASHQGAGLRGGSRDESVVGHGDERGVLTTTRPLGHGGYMSMEDTVRNGNSSSPSHGDYSTIARSGAVNVSRPSKIDESQANDWEVVVDMYRTGRGTEDGVALKLITKGDGRRVADRKLLEKRRTIGKTYECLGADRFEAAIGYKYENGVRRKQKMYHVISRCRVVNAMRKAGETIPKDHDKLTGLIDERLAEKEAQKEAGRKEMAAAAAAGNAGNNVSRVGCVVGPASYAISDGGRGGGILSRGPGMVGQNGVERRNMGVGGLDRMNAGERMGNRAEDTVEAVGMRETGRYG